MFPFSRVLSDNQLTISALLDPRFHRLININNFSNCVKTLTEKYDKITEAQGISPSIVSPKSSQNRPKTTNTNAIKKSSMYVNYCLLFNKLQKPPFLCSLQIWNYFLI